MNVGDLVQINDRCDARVLRGMRGIVTEVLHKHPGWCGNSSARLLVRVLLPLRLALLRMEHMEVISETR